MKRATLRGVPLLHKFEHGATRDKEVRELSTDVIYKGALEQQVRVGMRVGTWRPTWPNPDPPIALSICEIPATAQRTAGSLLLVAVTSSAFLSAYKRPASSTVITIFYRGQPVHAHLRSGKVAA